MYFFYFKCDHCHLLWSLAFNNLIRLFNEPSIGCSLRFFPFSLTMLEWLCVCVAYVDVDLLMCTIVQNGVQHNFNQFVKCSPFCWMRTRHSCLHTISNVHVRLVLDTNKHYITSHWAYICHCDFFALKFQQWCLLMVPRNDGRTCAAFFCLIFFWYGVQMPQMNWTSFHLANLIRFNVKFYQLE